MARRGGRPNSRGPQGRRGKRQRQQKTVVQLLVEGEVTERQYFEKLKDMRRWSQSISLTVLPFDKGKPLSQMVRKAEDSLAEEGVDQVFLILDKDELTDAQLAEAARRANLKKNQGRLHVCISAPKFEIWLCAHFQPMKLACDDKKVTEVEEKLKILRDSSRGRARSKRKHMPLDFPYSELETAMKNSNVAELGNWNNQGSTSIPKVIEILDSLNSNNS